MRVSLEDQVVKYLCDQETWIAKGHILKIEFKNQKTFVPYIASTVDRALRTAQESSKIAVRYEGKNTLYKWIPHHLRERYIPIAERVGDKLFKDDVIVVE